MPRETFAGGDAEITRQHDRIMQRYPESTAPATNRAPRNVHLEPTRLFNGMIAPVAPYSIRGMVWYQGENNVHQGDVSDYATMMQAMVGSWRKLWGQGEFPFFYVQIAPYGKYPKSGSPLPEMWEQQTRSLAIIPSSGMAAISDLGNPGDIHPKNKREVGRRLSSIALAKTYNVEGVECDAPMLVSAQREGHKVRVHLSGGAGLKSRDGKPLNFFEVAGGDGAFSPAKASIDGADIVVECAAIAEPSSVRFGWDATAAPNLVNGAGLPAVAFRAAVK
jgi:sialate O-acetylesterase